MGNTVRVGWSIGIGAEDFYRESVNRRDSMERLAELVDARLCQQFGVDDTIETTVEPGDEDHDFYITVITHDTGLADVAPVDVWRAADGSSVYWLNHLAYGYW